MQIRRLSLLLQEVCRKAAPTFAMKDFFRYPHTPHVAWLSTGEPRDDKVLTSDDVAELLNGEVVVEEKLDGANLGFSIGPDGNLRVQNRGQYLLPPYSGQFARLGDWLNHHEDRLFDGLQGTMIAFGEWCAAKHSLDYDELPDWLLLFDIYDCEAKRFWSTVRRNDWAARFDTRVVPQLFKGRANIETLLHLTTSSFFREGQAEGVIVRKEDPLWLLRKAKLVRPDFTQAISEHWRSRRLEWNRLSN